MKLILYLFVAQLTHQNINHKMKESANGIDSDTSLSANHSISHLATSPSFATVLYTSGG